MKRYSLAVPASSLTPMLAVLGACAAPGDPGPDPMRSAGATDAHDVNPAAVATSGEEGRAEPLSVSPAGEAPDDAGDEQLVRAQVLLEEARGARERGDHAAARSACERAIGLLLSDPEQGDDEARTTVLYELGLFGNDAGAARAAERALRRVLAVRMRTRPADHREVQTARMNLAVSLAALGDAPGACTLEEQAFEAFSRTQPPDQPDLQAARMSLGATLFSLGEFGRARELFEKALEVYSRTVPADHRDLQAARLNLAQTTKQSSDFERARELEAAVLEVFSRTLPEEDPDLQQVRTNYAKTIAYLGEFPAAQALQERVIDVYSRTLPADHLQLQRAKLALAETLYTVGQKQRARGLEEAVFEVYSRTLPGGHPELQDARLKLAGTLHDLGELQQARMLFEQGFEVAARARPGDHPELQSARLGLAAAYVSLGELAGARELCEQALEVNSRTLPADHVEIQRARVNLAAVLIPLGDFPSARALLEQAHEALARTRPATDPELQLVRSNLGSTLMGLGEFQRAKALFTQVIETLSLTRPEDHLDLQMAREHLALTLHLLGDPQGARALLEHLLKIRTRVLSADHLDLQHTRMNLAILLGTIGDLAGARALQEQALEVCSRTLPADHDELQSVRGGLALTLAVQAARSAREPGRRSGELAEEQERCERLLLDACRTQTSSARAILLSVPGREAEERCARMSRSVDLALSLAQGLGGFEPGPSLTRAVFVLAETTRASGLAAARLAHFARTDERYSGLRSQLGAAGEELARLAQTGGTRAEFEAAVQARDLVQRDLVRLAGASGDAASLVSEPDPTALAAHLAEDQAIVAYLRYTRFALSEGQSRVRDIESLCVFVLRTESELRLVDLGPIEPIETAVAGWRTALGAGAGRGVPVERADSSTSATREHAQRIRRLVLDPLLTSLRGVRRLGLVFDDVLHAIPIDELPAGDPPGEELMGDRFEIELRSTVQEFRADAAQPTRDGLALLLGGADYSAQPALHRPAPVADGASPPSLAKEPAAAVAQGLLRGGPWGEGFAPLPGSDAEARGLEALAVRPDVALEVVRLGSADASRASIDALAPRARFLHFATHGWFAPDQIRSWSDPDPTDEFGHAQLRLSAEERVKGSSPMLLCGLALAGANLPADALGRRPGLVTAEEISGWDLSHCELAVLSACDTNVGERRAGQGVASLQKALHMAGARSVITSLWKVPDEATKDLMLDFYRRIWVAKEPKAQALWNAKKRLREAKDERGQPKYSTRDWAAWVLTGDPD